MAYQYRGTNFEDDPITTNGCGTYAGYARHKHYNIPPCDPCRKAAAQYIADYRARKAAA